MDVVVLSNKPMLPAQRVLIEQRVRQVTQRMAGLLRRATVRLRDLNGPKGGVEQQCQIQLSTDRGGLLVVSHRSAHWRSSLDMALSRASLALRRQLDLNRKKASPHMQ